MSDEVTITEVTICGTNRYRSCSQKLHGFVDLSNGLEISFSCEDGINIREIVPTFQTEMYKKLLRAYLIERFPEFKDAWMKEWDGER